MHDKEELENGIIPSSVHKLYSTQEFTGQNGVVVKRGSLSTMNNLKVIKEIFLALRPENTIEVGMALGGSALLFNELHKTCGTLKPDCHTAIDPFQFKKFDGIGYLNLKANGFEHSTEILDEYSYLALPTLLSKPKKFKLAYVDGSHLFEDAFLDFYYLLFVVEEGGVILFDDSSYPDVLKLITFIRKAYAGILEEIDLSLYRNDIKGFNLYKYKVAKKLGKIQLTGFKKITANVKRKWNSKFIDF